MRRVVHRPGATIANSRRLGNRVRDLRVRIHPGGMILQGRTATYHAKQLAQHVVMTVTTVPIAANEIEVD